MKFITEYDLRAQFNEQPFTEYRIKENVRLTPGARQFLSDWRISLLEGVEEPQKHDLTINQNEQKDPLKIARLVSNMEILEAEFLVIASQIIEENIKLAGGMLKVGQEFGQIRLFLTGEIEELDICFEACAGMKGENGCQDMGNCLKTSDFYIQSANGKALVQLNALRAKLRAVRLDLIQTFRDPEDEQYLTAATEAVNKIINKLSQLMCVAAVVKECRRVQ